MTPQSADRVTREIAVALSNRDMAIGFLIGAGCGMAILTPSGEPLIPGIDVLSTRVCEALKTSGYKTHLDKLSIQFSEDGEACLPNIERLLTRIRGLREISGNGLARGLSGSELNDLDEAICRSIEALVKCDLPAGANAYTAFAAWVGSIVRHKAVEIFSTNYDLLSEQAFERQRVPFFDGFAGAHEPFFDITAMEMDSLPPRWARLWKVHGSINWRLDGDAVVRSLSGTKKPLIFPSHLKYSESRRLPYLAMRDRLRNFFRAVPSFFVTCGYSFSDIHLNEDIVTGLTANRNSVCYALLYEDLAKYPDAQRIAFLHPNLNVVARDKGIIRGSEIVWIDHLTIGDFASFGSFLRQQVIGAHS